MRSYNCSETVSMFRLVPSKSGRNGTKVSIAVVIVSLMIGPDNSQGQHHEADDKVMALTCAAGPSNCPA